MTAGVQAIHFGRRALGDYAELAGEERLERLRELAGRLKGASIRHLSAAAPRGGVPEQLRALLPLLADLELDVEWHVLFGGRAWAEAARDMWNGMQGAETALDEASWGEYLRVSGEAAMGLVSSCDVLVLHEPQCLAALGEGEVGPRVVWRCHVDASGPFDEAWERALPLLERCDLGVFSADGFAPPQLGGDTAVIHPAIDPLSPKNMEMPLRLAGRVLRSMGLDLTRPLVCNVARLDRWKDPHAVVDAFLAAKEELPELQLLLAGSLPGDGPEDWRIVREVSDYARAMRDIHFLTNYTGVGETEVGAIQRVARVQLQRSLREGFGLAASEALWKRTPVVAGPQGGVPLQVRGGRDGYLTDDTDETARRLVELVRDPALATELGASGREHVRERFLVTRLLEDELHLLERALAGRGATVGS